MTYREAVTSAASRLAASPHLRDTALPDAARLLLGTLGVERTQLLAYPDRLLSGPQQAAYDRAIQRRLQNEPTQYILGHTEFFGLRLKVTPVVLIPRPETELLVEAVLARIPPNAGILDIGTGSGAIAIALAFQLPEAHVTAVDLSWKALEVARENARAHGLDTHISFLESDLFSALDPAQRFDAIVSNPPYVPEPDASTLHPQVRDFEPAQALYAGSDGLEIYRRLIPQAREHLSANGLLALEIGHGQRDAITALLTGWREVQFLNDLQGIPRTAIARRC